MIAAELESGKGGRAAVGNRAITGGRVGTKSGFADEEILCLYCHVDFLSPNNHISPTL